MRVVTIAFLIVMHLQVNAQLFSNNYMAQPFNAPKINTQKAAVYIPGVEITNIPITHRSLFSKGNSFVYSVTVLSEKMSRVSG